MRKNFKMLVRHGTVYLLKYEIGLFGPDWSSIASFSEECKPECKRIVQLLNECDCKTNKDNDNDREGNT